MHLPPIRGLSVLLDHWESIFLREDLANLGPGNGVEIGTLLGVSSDDEAEVFAKPALIGGDPLRTEIHPASSMRSRMGERSAGRPTRGPAPSFSESW